MFSIVLTILSGFASATPLRCISMRNQDCKIRPQVVSVNGDELAFFHLVMKQVNVVVAVIISIILMQTFVFLMLQKA